MQALHKYLYKFVEEKQKREPTIADSLHLNVYESKLKHLRVPVRFRFIVESIVVKH